jgi:hypothetical protein
LEFEQKATKPEDDLTPLRKVATQYSCLPVSPSPFGTPKRPRQPVLTPSRTNPFRRFAKGEFAKSLRNTHIFPSNFPPACFPVTGKSDVFPTGPFPVTGKSPV